jgi:hypothetical protein
MGAGLVVPANKPQSLPEHLKRVASGEGVDGARAFAANHAAYRPGNTLEAALAAIECAP